MYQYHARGEGSRGPSHKISSTLITGPNMHSLSEEINVTAVHVVYQKFCCSVATFTYAGFVVLSCVNGGIV